jgi:SCF-associated factor 1
MHPFLPRTSNHHTNIEQTSRRRSAMDNQASSIINIPLDILLLILPYLDPKSFLALCSTCKALQQPSIRLEPSYWRQVTRATFRVPNQPVVEHDGARWQNMYRRLLTQTRVFTWGSNNQTRLGHSYEPNTGYVSSPRVVRLGILGRPLPRRLDAGPSKFPMQMEDIRSLGVIADMQCGYVTTCWSIPKSPINEAYDPAAVGQRPFSPPRAPSIPPAS